MSSILTQQIQWKNEDGASVSWSYVHTPCI